MPVLCAGASTTRSVAAVIATSATRLHLRLGYLQPRMWKLLWQALVLLREISRSQPNHRWAHMLRGRPESAAPTAAPLSATGAARTRVSAASTYAQRMVLRQEAANTGEWVQ